MSEPFHWESGWAAPRMTLFFVKSGIWEPAVCMGKYGKNAKFWGRKRGEEKEKSTFSQKKLRKLAKISKIEVLIMA